MYYFPPPPKLQTCIYCGAPAVKLTCGKEACVRLRKMARSVKYYQRIAKKAKKNLRKTPLANRNIDDT